MPHIHVDCALCDKFCAIWHDVRYGYKVIKNHRKQSGLAPCWPVCTTLKMAATGIRKYHILAPVITIFSCNTIFYMFSGVRIPFLKYCLCLEVMYCTWSNSFSNVIYSQNIQCVWQLMVTLYAEMKYRSNIDACIAEMTTKQKLSHIYKYYIQIPAAANIFHESKYMFYFEYL